MSQYVNEWKTSIFRKQNDCFVVFEAVLVWFVPSPKTELENTNLGVKGWAAMQPVQPHGLEPSPKATASGSKKNGIPEVAGEVKTLISSYQESTLELTSLTDERKETPEAWVSCTAGFDAAAAICATHDQKLVAMSTEEKHSKATLTLLSSTPKS